MLNTRQVHIIDILNDANTWVLGKQLSQILHVSDRTIRLDMVAINDYYQCTLITSNRRLGYRIDKSLVHKQEIQTKTMIPQSSHERCVYIIQELLFKSQKLNLIGLQDQVFVSGYSIGNDIKKIRKIIQKYPNLKLVRSKNYLYLSGNEEDKRSLYKALLTEEIKGNFMNLNVLASLWTSFDLLEVKDVLEEVCEKYAYNIRKTNFPMVILHAGVAIERIINRNFIHTISVYQELKDSIEYQISLHFFTLLNTRVQIEIVEEEIYLFALLLMGKKGSHYRRNLLKEETTNVDTLVEMMIYEIKEHFGIDFSKDIDLKVGLSMHLQSLLERQRNEIEVTNVYLQEIKRKYPLIFEMSVRAGAIIQNMGNKYVNENELAFLALHLGTAYERVNDIQKYRAVIIVPHTQSLSRMCLDKIKQRFDERMEVIATYNFFEEKMILEEEPDLLITTVPLKHTLPIKTIQISLFINHEDESDIFQALNVLDKKKHHAEFVQTIQGLMRSDLFYIKEKMNSSQEIIEFLCDELITKELASEEYKNDVFKREEVSNTSFVNGFAVPHAIAVTAKKSCIATMILNHPVSWGEYEVKLVILLAIRDTDTHLLKVFFDWLSSIVVDTQRFGQLLEVHSHSELMQEIVTKEI
jgi:lichenan operon transcriptional antiterminator